MEEGQEQLNFFFLVNIYISIWKYKIFQVAFGYLSASSNSIKPGISFCFVF